MQVYLCSLCDLPQTLLERMEAALPPARRAKAAACRKPQARAACAVGYHLVRYATRVLMLPPPKADFAIHPSGKPYIPELTLQFNLSHSNGLVALAVSKTQPVGVDIEKIRSLRPGFAERWLTASELADLARAEDRAAALTLLWTAKEAAAKQSGAGLGYRPQEISTADTAGILLAQGEARYALSVSPAAPISPIWVDPAEFDI